MLTLISYYMHRKRAVDGKKMQLHSVLKNKIELLFCCIMTPHLCPHNSSYIYISIDFNMAQVSFLTSADGCKPGNMFYLYVFTRE